MWTVSSSRTIAQKLATSFRLVTGLLVLCGITGLAASGFLSRTLAYISGPAWETADGAMESVIGIEAQMLAASIQAADPADPHIAELYDEGRAMQQEALSQLLGAGLMASGQRNDLEQAARRFEADVDGLMRLRRELQDRHEAVLAALTRFEKGIRSVAENAGSTPGVAAAVSEGDYWRAQHALQVVERQVFQLAAHDHSLTLNTVTQGLDTVTALMTRLAAWTPADIAEWQTLQQQFLQSQQQYVLAREAYDTSAEAFLDQLEVVEQWADGRIDEQLGFIRIVQVTSIAAILLCIIVSVWLSRRLQKTLSTGITAPIHNVIDMASGLSQGRLDMVSHVDSQDETAEMVQAFMRLQTSTREVMARVRFVAERAAQGDFSERIATDGLGGY